MILILGRIFHSAHPKDKSEVSVVLWPSLEVRGGRVEKQQRKRNSAGAVGWDTFSCGAQLEKQGY